MSQRCNAFTSPRPSIFRCAKAHSGLCEPGRDVQMSDEIEISNLSEDAALKEAMEILHYLAYVADPENKELRDAAFDIASQLQERDDAPIGQHQQQQYPQQRYWQSSAPRQMAAETPAQQRQQQQERQQQIEPKHRTTPKQFVAVVQRAVEKKRGVTFSTPVFKCLSDFDKCSGSHTRRLCLSLLVICVGRQCLPFLKA
jgi:hypothetical protein